MILDLSQATSLNDISTDVLIIGAGIAGLVLATELQRSKLRIAVLESGGLEPLHSDDPLNEVVMLADPYRGAIHGRARCLGGTSTRWGGALIPFLSDDLMPRPHLGLQGWGIDPEQLFTHLRAAERLFGLDNESYDADIGHLINEIAEDPRDEHLGGDFLPRFAKWPKFRRRNIASLLNAAIKNDPNLDVVVNATVTGFKFNEQEGRLEGATASNLAGKQISVAANRVIICAGAIESTRLLLLLDHEYEGKIFRNCEALGKYFHDHISAVIANIVPGNPVALNRLSGFRFKGGTMRSLRFELSPSAQRREGLTSAFSHINFRTNNPTGFDALRDLLRELQRTGRISTPAALDACKDLPYLVQAGYWRYARKQLLWPRPATYELHAVVEQPPRVENYISLASETDAFGLPLAAICWRVAPEDYEALQSHLRLFNAYWSESAFSRIARIEELAADSRDAFALPTVADIYHPGGSTRIGPNERCAVVDANLRTFAISNLWVLATSVFPSTASANPTLTLILLTLRLSEQLKNP